MSALGGFSSGGENIRERIFSFGIPGQQYADTAAQLRRPAGNNRGQIPEGFIPTGNNAGQNFQNFIGAAKPSSGSKAICVSPDKHQIQQRFPGLDLTGE